MSPLDRIANVSILKVPAPCPRGPRPLFCLCCLDPVPQEPDLWVESVAGSGSRAVMFDLFTAGLEAASGLFGRGGSAPVSAAGLGPCRRSHVLWLPSTCVWFLVLSR